MMTKRIWLALIILTLFFTACAKKQPLSWVQYNEADIPSREADQTSPVQIIPPRPSASASPTPSPSLSAMPTPFPTPSPSSVAQIRREVLLAEASGGSHLVGAVDFSNQLIATGTIAALTGYNFAGGINISSGRVKDFSRVDIVTSPKAGTTPLIEIWNGQNGSRLLAFLAYASDFMGGVSVATCDLYGDSRDELVTAAYSAGGPHVKVFDLRGNLPIQVASFMAYDGVMPYGMHVACAKNQITLAPNVGGGAHVQVFNLAEIGGALIVSATPSEQFFAFDNYTGGTLVARGDVNGDGISEIITAQATGGERHVRVFSGGGSHVLLSEFSAFDSVSFPFLGEMSLASGDVNGDGRDDIIVGSGAGGSSVVRIFSGLGNTLLYSQPISGVFPNFNPTAGISVNFISP